jgi:hypothetical protein
MCISLRNPWVEQGLAFAASDQPQRGRLKQLRTQALSTVQQKQIVEQALEQAVLVIWTMPAPAEEAKALHVPGELNQAKGESAQVCERLEMAWVIPNQYGERWWAEQVERALAINTAQGTDCGGRVRNQQRSSKLL